MDIHSSETTSNHLNTRCDFQEIENKLHPLITIDGVLIQHKHIGPKILFYPEVNGVPLTNRQFAVKRESVLEVENFYETYRNRLVWLIGKIEQPEETGE